MTTALLNAPVESAVCLNMLRVANKRLGLMEKKLGQQVLDREAYCQAIGAALELRLLITEMEQLYAREFRV